MAIKVAVINGKEPSGGVGGVSDADLSNLAVNFLTSGIVGTDDYKVQEKGTPDMSVDVLIGKAYVPNSDNSMLYHTELDTNANVVISNNSSGNDRIDALVIKIDLGVTPNSNADNVATLHVVEGTPAASPSAPTDNEIQTDVGAGNPFYRLADIDVANGAASITNADIASTRSQATLTTKKRVGTIASSATPTPSWDDHDVYTITALAVAAELQNPSGTPTNGQGLVIRIKDNGTARALTYDTQYRAIGVDLPTTTVANKTIYLGGVWNSADSKLDIVAVAQEA